MGPEYGGPGVGWFWYYHSRMALEWGIPGVTRIGWARSMVALVYFLSRPLWAFFVFLSSSEILNTITYLFTEYYIFKTHCNWHTSYIIRLFNEYYYYVTLCFNGDPILTSCRVIWCFAKINAFIMIICYCLYLIKLQMVINENIGNNLWQKDISTYFICDLFYVAFLIIAYVSC